MKKNFKLTLENPFERTIRPYARTVDHAVLGLIEHAHEN